MTCLEECELGRTGVKNEYYRLGWPGLWAFICGSCKFSVLFAETARNKQQALPENFLASYSVSATIPSSGVIYGASIFKCLQDCECSEDA